MKRSWSHRGLVMILISLAAQFPAGACAPAPPRGAFAEILEEAAIIVWDPANHVEHFIRRAAFHTDAPDFGFLVPTPSIPELAEASDDAFQMIPDITRPEVLVKEDKGVRFTFLLWEMLRLQSREDARVMATPSVRILSTQHVAGYDAVVLEADDAAALNGWLDKHGYPSSPELQAWFEPYVAMKWKITAFKIAGDKSSENAVSGTVRMSFATDRPFFPYREPKMTGTQSERVLQIFLLSDARMDGALEKSPSWPGHLEWSSSLKPETRDALLQKLALPQTKGLPDKLWLNAFEDRSSPRPGTEDLYFRKADNQTPIVPPPFFVHSDHRIPIPMELVILIAVIAVFRYRRRSKQQRSL